MIGASNPAVAAQLAQRMTQQDLSHAAQGGHPQIPPYVAASELMRRQELQRRAQGMAAMGQSAQDRSVLQDLLDGQEINPDGIGSLPAMVTPQQGQQQLQQQETPQPPEQGQSMYSPPDRQSFASGGLVAFDNGGPVSRSPFAAPWMTKEYMDALHSVSSPSVPGESDMYKRYAQSARTSPLQRGGDPTWDWQGVNYVEPEPDLENYQFPATAQAPGGGGGAGVAPAGAALGSGIRSLPPATSELPPFLQDAPKVKTMEEYAAERKAMLPPGEAYEKLQQEASDLRGKIESRRSGNIGEALLQAGSAMAASRSPYFMQAAGEGGMAGLASLREGRKDIDALDQLRVRYESTVEGARRAEAIGNVDKAQEMHKQAEDLAEKYRQLQTIFTYHDLSSQRYAQSRHGELAQSRELAHQDRIASLEAQAFREGYHSELARLKNNPMTMQMDSSEMERRALEADNKAVTSWRGTQQRGGIADIPAATPGRLRGRLDSSGSLVPNNE